MKVIIENGKLSNIDEFIDNFFIDKLTLSFVYITPLYDVLYLEFSETSSFLTCSEFKDIPYNRLSEYEKLSHEDEIIARNFFDLLLRIKNS